MEGERGGEEEEGKRGKEGGRERETVRERLREKASKFVPKISSIFVP